ncbi:MAG: hypothetical protein KC964_29330, partial [Candidatus Omnitrophica bacterium]|nr:hypothetical protein [Candidatus Omnitrophota bacterium]
MNKLWMAPILLLMICPRTVTADPIDIGSRLELFVDDYLIDTLTGAELQLQSPTPREVAIIHDEPWEGNSSGYHTVFQDGDLYRMYYRGHQYTVKEDSFGGAHREVVCYAESRDGVHWEKPDLGLVDYEDSKSNNIIWDATGSHNFTPFIDANPDCKPDEKYKALGGVGNGLFIFSSADGINWNLMDRKPVITEGAFDSQNVAFWDETRNHYAAYFRTFTQMGDRKVRSIAMTTSPDFIHWATPTALEYPGSPIEQLYTNQVIPYHRAPHLLLGFPTRYVDRPLTDHVKTIDPVELRALLLKSYRRCGTDLTDGLFMTSRDGQTFHRWGEAFIRPGLQEKGNWTYGDIYQNYGIVETKWDPGCSLEALEELNVPSELSIYVSEGSWRTGETRERRYTLRIDGFVSVHAPLPVGELVTKPIVFSGNRLQINYSSSAAGSVRVELQDP